MTFHTDIFQDSPAHTGAWRGVYFDGPQSDQNQDGDEIPVWVVYIGDDDAEPVSHLSKFHSYQIAADYAEQLARSRRLELIHEASPA